MLALGANDESRAKQPSHNNSEASESGRPNLHEFELYNHIIPITAPSSSHAFLLAAGVPLLLPVSVVESSTLSTRRRPSDASRGPSLLPHGEVVFDQPPVFGGFGRACTVVDGGERRRARLPHTPRHRHTGARRSAREQDRHTPEHGSQAERDDRGVRAMYGGECIAWRAGRAFCSNLCPSPTLPCAVCCWRPSPAYRNFDDYSPRGDSIGTWQSCVCLALGLVGVAAGAGTFRFAGIGPIRPIHEFLAALAMYVSMPLIGLASVMAFSSVSNPTIPVSAVVGLVGVFLAFRRFPRQLQQPYQETYVLLTSLFGVLCALFRSLFILAGRSGSLSAESRTAAWYGLGGTLLIMLAGAVTAKGVRKMGPIAVRNVDLFHCTNTHAHEREARG